MLKLIFRFLKFYFDEKKYMDDAGGIGILFLNHNIKRIINSQNTDVFGVYMKEGEH